MNRPVNRVGPGENVLEREHSEERKGADRLPFPPPLRFMPFLLSYPALLDTRELFDCKKTKQNKKQLPRAFCKHWSLVLIHTLATVNIPLPSVLVKGVSALDQ